MRPHHTFQSGDFPSLTSFLPLPRKRRVITRRESLSLHQLLKRCPQSGKIYHTPVPQHKHCTDGFAPGSTATEQTRRNHSGLVHAALLFPPGWFITHILQDRAARCWGCSLALLGQRLLIHPSSSTACQGGWLYLGRRSLPSASLDSSCLRSQEQRERTVK